MRPLWQPPSQCPFAASSRLSHQRSPPIPRCAALRCALEGPRGGSAAAAAAAAIAAPACARAQAPKSNLPTTVRAGRRGAAAWHGCCIHPCSNFTSRYPISSRPCHFFPSFPFHPLTIKSSRHQFLRQNPSQLAALSPLLSALSHSSSQWPRLSARPCARPPGPPCAWLLPAPPRLRRRSAASPPLA